MSTEKVSKKSKTLREVPLIMKRYYLKKDGGKNVINIKRALISTIVLLAGVFLPVSIYQSFKNADTSKIAISSSKLISNSKGKKNMQEKKNTDVSSSSGFGGIHNQTSSPEANNSKNVLRRRYKSVRVNYRAKQVLSAGKSNNAGFQLMGVNLIGKLLTSIDTRSSDPMVKVILPYGGRHKGSGSSLPANTLLFGKFNYVGNGEKVLLNFNRALLPNGEELRLKAKALGPKDYSLGISGQFHGNTTGRAASVLGLKMVGSMTETLVQKEALGQGFSITPKASLKNGVYQGLSDVANSEASRKVKELSKRAEYVTVDAGKDLIISIISGPGGR